MGDSSVSYGLSRDYLVSSWWLDRFVGPKIIVGPTPTPGTLAPMGKSLSSPSHPSSALLRVLLWLFHHGRWTSYMVALFPQSACPKRTRQKLMSFWLPALIIHRVLIFLYCVGQSDGGPSQIQPKRRRCHVLMGE